MFERNFAVAINLNHNELRNAIFHRLSEEPAPLNTFEGAFYYNDAEHVLYYYNGTKWVKNMEYVVKLLGETGNNIVSIYQGTNIAGNEFKFKLLKGENYIKLADSGNYITLKLDSDKLDEYYGLSKTIQTLGLEDIPVGGVTVLCANDGNVVFPFTSTQSVYDYTNQKTLDETLQDFNVSIEEVTRLIGSGTTYNSEYDDSLTTTAALGNIPAGTRLSTLKGKGMTELLNMMFFSETWPASNLAHTVRFSGLPSLVEEGSNVQWPSVEATWNNQILPVSEITYRETLTSPNNTEEQKSELLNSTFDDSGNWTYKMYYSYPAGSYDITSNFGNTRSISVPAVTNSVKSGTIKVTRAVLINNTKQSLFPLNEQHVITKSLGGSPEIKVPWANSSVKVEVDLGFGYMEVSGWSNTTEGEYRVLRKTDSYQSSVPHRITITLHK